MESKVSEGGLNVTLTIRLLMHGKVRGSLPGSFLTAPSPTSAPAVPESSKLHAPPPQPWAARSRCPAGGEGGTAARCSWPLSCLSPTLPFCWRQRAPGLCFIVGLGWIVLTFCNVDSFVFGFFSVGSWKHHWKGKDVF